MGGETITGPFQRHIIPNNNIIINLKWSALDGLSDLPCSQFFRYLQLRDFIRTHQNQSLCLPSL